MPPPSSTAPPTIGWPQPAPMSKNQARVLAGTESISWIDTTGGQIHVATIGAHSATSLTITAAAAPTGTQTYDLTGDGTAQLPIVRIYP